MENRIVTLEDGKEYCIISSTLYNGDKFYCGVEYFEEKEDIGNKYFIFKELGDSLELIDNNELQDYILLKIGSENDELLHNN